MTEKESHKTIIRKKKAAAKQFTEFFLKQKPEKIREALDFISTLESKSFEELNIALTLTKSEKIKEIIKGIMKLKINNL